MPGIFAAQPVRVEYNHTVHGEFVPFVNALAASEQAPLHIILPAGVVNTEDDPLVLPDGMSLTIEGVAAGDAARVNGKLKHGLSKAECMAECDALGGDCIGLSFASEAQLCIVHGEMSEELLPFSSGRAMEWMGYSRPNGLIAGSAETTCPGTWCAKCSTPCFAGGSPV